MESVKSMNAVKAPSALNPEQLALTQPWKDFVSRGLVTEITVKFTPGGTHVVIALSEKIPIKDSLLDRKTLPPGLAKQIVLDSGLLPKKGKSSNPGSKEEALPVRSICAKDVENSNTLEARIRAVAGKLGSSTALGRINSKKLHIQGVKTFQEWWSSASPEHKVQLVIDEKHLKSLTGEQLVILNEKLQSMESPFRGPLPQPTSDDSAEEKENKEGEKSAMPGGFKTTPPPAKRSKSSTKKN